MNNTKQSIMYATAIHVHGDRAKAAREKSKLRLGEASALLDIYHTRLSDIENKNTTRVNKALVVNMANLYDCNPDYLIGLSDTYDKRSDSEYSLDLSNDAMPHILVLASKLRLTELEINKFIKLSESGIGQFNITQIQNRLNGLKSSIAILEKLIYDD